MSGRCAKEEQPESNLWALDFGYEASKPFLSIRIQNFVRIRLSSGRPADSERGTPWV